MLKNESRKSFIFSLGCSNPGWVGDGYCDDVTNNMACNYDGGDCCGDNVNTNYCSECQCMDGSGSTESTTSGTTSPSGMGKIIKKERRK